MDYLTYYRQRRELQLAMYALCVMAYQGDALAVFEESLSEVQS